MNDDSRPTATDERAAFFGRDRSIDIAKGIGIWLVVLGHVLDGLNGTLSPDTVRDASRIFIYTFHMALFFSLSGAYSGRSAVEPDAVFAKRLWRSFVYPYVLWSVVLLTSHHLMSAYTNTRVDRVDVLSILYRPPAVMWFLYVLLGAFLILRATRRWPAPLQITLAIVLCTGGYFLHAWLWGHLRFVGLFLLAARLGLPSRKILADACFLRIALFAMVMTAAIAFEDAGHGVSGYPAHAIVYLPAAFAGTYLVLCVSTWLDRAGHRHSPARVTAWVLVLLGRRTMPIFVTHILFTAGTRIVLRRLEVHDGWIIGIAATLAGLLLPVVLAATTERLGMSRMLGWPVASRMPKPVSTAGLDPKAG